MQEQVETVKRGDKIPVPIEIVDKLPEVAVRDKIVYNKTDKYFYIGIENKEVN